MRRLFAIAIGSILATSAQAAPPEELRPSGPWKVEYADHSCVLGRSFSTGEQQYDFALTFEPIQPHAWLRIISSDNIRARDDGDATIDIDGRRLPNILHYNIFPNDAGGTTREFWLRDLPQVLSARTSLRVTTSDHGDLTLHIDEFAKAVAAANACMGDLYRSLGIDSAIVAQVATPPEGLALSFVRYPRTRSGFDLKLLYWVTAEGKVEDCRVLAPSGLRNFDKRVCAELERKGKFKPAQATDGSAIRAPVYDDIRLRVQRL